jgi:O-antigen ligase
MDNSRQLLPSRWEAVLGLGLGWMMIGMLVMPAGISYNPGRLYQITLILLLYLPALYLVLRQRAALWRELWPQPTFRVFLLLLAWATLSLCWARLHRPGDEFGRILSVTLFVLGCHAWAGVRPQRIRVLLTLVGWGMAACALVYSVLFLRASPAPEDARIVGEGVIATANYAAAAMGAACIWLAQLPQHRRASRLACLAAVAALLVFIALTQSRSVWLALATCAILTPLWQRRRAALGVALAVFVLALVALLWPLPVLMERGASYRPQILLKALHLIALHPWLGLGQGAGFVIEVGGQHLTHSHNVLTQAAIELGLPGLLAMVAMWGLVAWSGWRHRGAPLGRVVLGLWVYASVALQFDMPQLLDSPRPGWLLIWLPFALALGLEARGHARQALPARVN